MSNDEKEIGKQLDKYESKVFLTGGYAAISISPDEFSGTTIEFTTVVPHETFSLAIYVDTSETAGDYDKEEYNELIDDLNKINVLTGVLLNKLGIKK